MEDEVQSLLDPSLRPSLSTCPLTPTAPTQRIQISNPIKILQRKTPEVAQVVRFVSGPYPSLKRVYDRTMLGSWV